jgi:predicted transcriptional regulator of viral defense system
MADLQLVQVALGQHGYFTTAQAAECDISRRALSGRVSAGKLERAAHGLYRIPHFPHTELDRLYEIAVLMPEATFSHQTALGVFDIAGVDGEKIHVTVDPASGAKPRPGVAFHRSNLAKTERVSHGGVWVTPIKRAIRDCIRIGVDPAKIRAAIEASYERGTFDIGQIDMNSWLELVGRGAKSQ